MEKPEFVWENLEPGTLIGAREVTVTPERVAAHCAATGTDPARYAAGGLAEEALAPPMIFINDLLAIYDENYRRFGTIHAKLSYRFHRPVRVGETVRQRATVKDLYVKRGKGWVVSELVVTGADGGVVATSLHTSVLSLTRRHEEAP